MMWRQPSLALVEHKRNDQLNGSALGSQCARSARRVRRRHILAPPGSAQRDWFHEWQSVR